MVVVVLLLLLLLLPLLLLLLLLESVSFSSLSSARFRLKALAVTFHVRIAEVDVHHLMRSGAIFSPHTTSTCR